MAPALSSCNSANSMLRACASSPSACYRGFQRRRRDARTVRHIEAASRRATHPDVAEHDGVGSPRPTHAATARDRAALTPLGMNSDRDRRLPEQPAGSPPRRPAPRVPVVPAKRGSTPARLPMQYSGRGHGLPVGKRLSAARSMSAVLNAGHGVRQGCGATRVGLSVHARRLPSLHAHRAPASSVSIAE